MEKKNHGAQGTYSWSKIEASSWISAIAAVLTIVASIFSILSISTTIDISRFLLVALIVTMGAMFVTVGFTLILSLRERSPSHIAKLKDDITHAYLNALRQSKLNPARGGQR
ncbi:MAG: hypothetical protein KJO08_10705 [Gammaproteobacteria bacterium]|nr:hypothetical protein [Gammaproteobacteria bacterium]NNJ84099.1 hypothetical protein [Gammaproteobacteria bacterium]